MVGAPRRFNHCTHLCPGLSPASVGSPQTAQFRRIRGTPPPPPPRSEGDGSADHRASWPPPLIARGGEWHVFRDGGKAFMPPHQLSRHLALPHGSETPQLVSASTAYQVTDPLTHRGGGHLRIPPNEETPPFTYELRRYRLLTKAGAANVTTDGWTSGSLYEYCPSE